MSKTESDIAPKKLIDLVLKHGIWAQDVVRLGYILRELHSELQSVCGTDDAEHILNEVKRDNALQNKFVDKINDAVLIDNALILYHDLLETVVKHCKDQPINSS